MRVHHFATHHPFSACCPLRPYFVRKFKISGELMVSYFNLMIAASSRRTISLRCAFASGEPEPHDRCIGSRAHWHRPLLFLLRTSAPLSTANGRGATRAHSAVQRRHSIVVDGISIGSPRRSGTPTVAVSGHGSQNARARHAIACIVKRLSAAGVPRPNISVRGYQLLRDLLPAAGGGNVHCGVANI